MHKVVIIDDEPMVRKRLRTIINWQQEGFQIAAEAGDGEEGLRISRLITPDLIITDIRMPVFNGLQLIRTLRQELPGCYFIILSGYADFQYAQEAMKSGIKDYLLKPVDSEELTAIITRIKIELETNKKQEKAVNTLNDITECTGKPQNIIEKVKKYIETHYADEITLRSLSKEIYMNPVYLGQLFKNKTGFTFNDYLTDVRLNKAIELLTNNELTVDEIACMVGYAAPGSFYKIFKKIYGCTPSDYRHKNVNRNKICEEGMLIT